MTERPEYSIKLRVNGRVLSRVVIDQHYRKKHDDLDDKLILDLVAQLDQGNFPIESRLEEFEYFRVEPVHWDKKVYRLVLVLCIHADYLGVVNAFRVRR